MNEQKFDRVMKERRQQIKLVAELVKGDLDHPETLYVINIDNPTKKEVKNTDEMQANIKLAYRHLEDASMRLGKAIQAYDGGKSAAPEVVGVQ